MSDSLFQPTKHDERCPQCQGILQIKRGKKGLFLGCSNYPDCTYLKPLGPQIEPKVLKDLEQHCPKCGHFLQLKQGHYGMFIGCSDYPNCRFSVRPDEQENEAQSEQESEVALSCPECQRGHLVARRGRQGKPFYACDRFPKCKFTLPSKPYSVDCPQCGGQVCMLKKTTETHRTWQCANKTCRHLFETEQ
ncbi:DNA topoisomerase family protein [Caviibacterium pharyngocola]|uniref:DNA topoisomerase type IA zn finger domain-containing protein n=1 Tax=Caviibacterium pharyngocola TaxID=28159 RepID=A0A2M8RUA7_9PAST|nr:type I DNA topoisomerase [Caviibacterium pharyngocola]PJG82467.1 hypothetical protein CVP04_09020 [Caviibacterium pharyngocola]